MKSPDFIKPSDELQDKEILVNTLKKIEREALQTISKEELHLLCLDMELPGFGKLTVYEWISFGFIHMQRHTVQLKKIAAALNKV